MLVVLRIGTISFMVSLGGVNRRKQNTIENTFLKRSLKTSDRQVGFLHSRRQLIEVAFYPRCRISTLAVVPALPLFFLCLSFPPILGPIPFFAIIDTMNSIALVGLPSDVLAAEKERVCSPVIISFYILSVISFCF